MRRRYLFYLCAAIIGGIYFSFMTFNPVDNFYPLYETVFQLSGSEAEFPLGFSYSELVGFLLIMFPLFIFEIYAGLMVYKYFCIASVYIFSRYTNRKGWYRKEAVRLYLLVLGFMLVMILSMIITVYLRGKYIIYDSEGFLLLFYHILIWSLYTYIMTMGINLLSMYFTSEKGYLIVSAYQIICLLWIYIAAQLFYKSEGTVSFSEMVLLNPIAHLVLQWNGSCLGILNNLLSSNYLSSHLETTIFVFLILALIVTFIGEKVVIHKDILVSNQETGVM